MAKTFDEPSMIDIERGNLEIEQRRLKEKQELNQVRNERANVQKQFVDIEQGERMAARRARFSGVYRTGRVVSQTARNIGRGISMATSSLGSFVAKPSKQVSNKSGRTQVQIIKNGNKTTKIITRTSGSNQPTRRAFDPIGFEGYSNSSSSNKKQGSSKRFDVVGWR